MNWFQKLMARMSIDDILAIVPNFEEFVNKVEKSAQISLEAESEMRMQIQNIINKADVLHREGQRTMNAVKKYRTIVKQGE